MADTKTEAIYTIRIEDGPALLKLEKQTRQLAEVRAERVRLNKEIRESIAKEAELAKAIDKGGAEAEGAAKQLANLTAKRDEDARALADQDLKFTKLSGTTRELKNDLSGLTEAGLRFRDKMADATLQALRQSGALEQLSARGEALQNDIKGVNVALEKNAATLATLEVAYRKGETTEAEYLRQQKLLEKENEALAASNDKLGQELGQVTTKLDKTEQQVKQLNAEFSAGRISQDEYRAGLQRIEDTTKGLGGKFDDFVKNQGKELKSTLSSVALQYVGVGAAIYGVQQVLGSAVNAVVDFDQALAKVKALGGDYRKDIDALGNAARELGPKFGIGVAESVKAVEELAKAGLSSSEILSGGLDAALSLVAAGGVKDVATAAGIAASALKQFGLEGSEMVHVADLLTNGANKARGGVEQLGEALNQSAIVAANTGLSVDETVTALSAFAEGGLLGSDAGTSFKTMLQSLIPRSKEAAEAMKANGIEAYDLQGRFIGLEAFAEKLRLGLKDMSEEQQQATLKTIFGSDAVRAATILYNNGADGIAKWSGLVSESGSAARVAQENLSSLAGQIKIASANWTAFVTGLDSGKGVISTTIRSLVELGNSLLQLMTTTQGELAGEKFGEAVQAGLSKSFGSFSSTLSKTELAVAFENEAARIAKARSGTIQQLAADVGVYAEEIRKIAAQGGKITGDEKLRLGIARQAQVELMAELDRRKKAEADTAKLIKVRTVVEDESVATTNDATDATAKSVETYTSLKTELKDLQKVRGAIDLSDAEALAKNAAQIQGIEARIEAIKGETKALTEKQKVELEMASVAKEAPEPIQSIAAPTVSADGQLTTAPQAEIEATNTIAATLDERIALYQEERDAYDEVQLAKIAAVGGFASALGQLTKEGTTAAKVLFALEKAAAIAQVIVNTVREVSAINALYAAVPGGQAIAAPLTLAAKIRGATGVATIAAQAIAGFAEGGDISGNVTRGWGIPIRRANGDNVLVRAGDRWITLKGNEKVLNERQQRKAEAIAGPSIWSDIGVPGYRAGKTGFAGGGSIDGAGGGVTYSAGTGIRAPLEDLIGDVMRLEIASIQRSIRAGLGGFVGGVDTLVSALGTPRPSPESVVAGDLSTVMRMFAERPTIVSVEEINRVQQQVHVTEAASRA